MLTYLVFIATIGGIYALLSLSLNLTWGSAGMVNLGLAGLFAIGGYTSAILSIAGAPIPLSIIIAMAAGAVAGIVLMLVIGRLEEVYLAIVTLGFAEFVRLVAGNEIWLTNGTDGISGIPQPLRSIFREHYDTAFLVLISLTVLLCFLLMRHIDRAPYGLALRAMREDMVVASVAGKPVRKLRIQVLALSGAVAGLAGALYAHFTTYVAPEFYQPLLTIYIFLCVSIGGLGRPAGAVLGAYMIILFLEGSRFLTGMLPGISALQLAAGREILVAVAILLLFRSRTSGILPEQSRKSSIS